VAGGQEQPDQPASEADEAFLRLTTSGHPNPLMSVDLTMQQLRTLMILSFHSSASGQQLADGLGAHISNVTGIINRLVSPRFRRPWRGSQRPPRASGEAQRRGQASDATRP
jgi:MarR family